MANDILNGIKNIIFDLGGVVINIDHHKTAEAFKKLGIDNFIDIFSHTQQHSILDDFEKGLLSGNEFRKAISNELKINISDTEFDFAWNAILLDIPRYRIEAINKLNNHFQLFMLSNTNSIHMDCMNFYLKNNFGVSSYSYLFGKAYYSFELKMRKPDKEIFQYVINDAKINPEETLFIDDFAPNLESAEWLGLKIYHHKNNSDDFYRELGLI